MQGHSGQIGTVRYGETFEDKNWNDLYLMILVLFSIGYDPHKN